MADAWDELRQRLGPKGEAAARALLDRLRSNERLRGWDCSLHLAGSHGRATTFWVEPAQRIPLTDSEEKAQNSASR